MVYFGYPTAQENDAERAVRAGLAILASIEKLNRGLAATGSPPLTVRIGIHAGSTVLTGSDEVFGDVPNMALRVQTAA